MHDAVITRRIQFKLIHGGANMTNQDADDFPCPELRTIELFPIATIEGVDLQGYVFMFPRLG